jgi:membrane-associated protease RseP (regulator of RpoE activity)
MAAPRPAKAVANTPAEWAMAIGGGLLLALGLVWVLRSGSDAPERPSAVAAVTPPPTLPVLQSAAPPAFAMPLPQVPGSSAFAAPAPAAMLHGLKLRGIIARGAGTAGAAILETPDGRQRLVRIGQAPAPGVRLVAVGAASVTLATADQRLQLDFGDARPAASAAPPPADERTRKIMGWKLALEPRRLQGRINGFTVLPGPLPPALERAGLRAGDVLLSVNQNQLNNLERVTDLADEVGGSYTAEFVFERGGQRQTKTLEINPRPPQAPTGLGAALESANVTFS